VLDAAGRHLVEHRLDESRLDADALVLGCEPVVRLDRPEHRVARCPTVEPVEAQRVREQAGDARLERVDLRERVLPERDQHAHGQVRARDELGQDVCERPLTLLVAVVEEELLELVEHEADLAADQRPELGEVLVQRQRSELDRLAESLGDTRFGRRANGLDRVAAPRVDERDGEPRLSVGAHVVARDRAEPRRHARTHHRRLADAARPVEHGQLRRHQVRGDHLRLPLAAEEEERVELGVPERRQTSERALRDGRDLDGRHAATGGGPGVV
jgi:hypothetical protein